MLRAAAQPRKISAKKSRNIIPKVTALRPISNSELAVVSVDSFPAPALIARASPTTRKKLFEFFTVPIRNANTRAAYCRAIQQFLAWAERAGYQDLEDIEPITGETDSSAHS